MFLALGGAWFYLPLLLPGFFLMLVGLYFIHWSTAGRGLWCRSCKTYPSTTAFRT